MPYQISTTQIDPETGLTHFLTLQGIATSPNPDWATFYSKIHDYTANPDDLGNIADPNVREWFSVASQANAGVGAPADLIRDYTAAQVAIRTGGTVSSATLDDASDAIAASIWSAMSTDGNLPTLEDIRTTDAQEVVAVLQADGHNVGFNVWSGNVLFVGLGDTQPLMDNLIPPSSNSSYDFLAAGQALNAAGLGSILGSGWGSALTFLSNTTSVLAANASTDDFLGRLYGDFAPSAIGAALFAKVGRQGDSDDLLTGSALQDAIHGGAGDDIIVGSFGPSVVPGLGPDLLDGGEGFDFVDFGSYLSPFLLDLTNQWIGSYNTGTVSYSGSVYNPLLLSSLSHLFNVEALRLGRSDDILRLDTKPTLQRIDGDGSLEKGDLIDLSDSTDGATVSLEGAGGTSGSVVLTSGSVEIVGFDNVNGTDHADTITGSDTRNTIRGGGETDTIDGGLGHDDIHGGEGDDDLQGGDGADWIYDRGADDDIGGNETADAYVNRVLAYDGDGNDTVRGGDGSDILVYSGGTDTFYGGAGDDTYLAVERTVKSPSVNDNLTIILNDENSGSAPDFGHDLISGNGRGIDRVIFEGINRGDVTVNYSYSEISLGSQVVDFNPTFPGWFWDPDPDTVEHYATVGTMELIVNGTSSLTIESVVGYHSKGANGGPLASIEATMSVPFIIEFADGLFDWPGSVLDPSTNYYTFEHSDLSGTAFAARGALEEERSVPEEDINGTEDDDDLYGNTGSDQISGNGGADRIYAGGGDDIIIGGAGADTIDGGSGTDTASYETASANVGIRLRDMSFQSGEAVGDSYTNVENLRGSAFDDYLGGDDQRNFIWGGAGNDRIFGFGGIDELHGGDGDDELSTSYWHDDRLYGGAGNDTLSGSSGDDFLYGGTGDDILISNYQPNIHGDLTPGNDYFDGGDGIDTAEFWYIDGGLVVDLGAGQAKLGATGEVVTMISIENATTERSDDVLIGSDGDNVLRGGDGDDLLVGGAGNDTLFGNDGDDRIFGGTGIDTARIFGATQAMASYALVEGGVVVTIDTSHPDTTWQTDGGTFTIYDDVEFIEFDDGIRTYQEIAGPLQTEFAVIDDFLRVDEAATIALDFTTNDIEFQSDPITLVTLNGEAVVPGLEQRLDSGATLTVEADGTVIFDQGGAYAWLDAGEAVTETFTYTATDSTGVEKSGTATVIVDGQASNPESLHLDNDLVLVAADPDNAAKTSVANFNIAKSVVIIDGVYIDPNTPPAGFTLEEINGDTFIMFGGDDAVILEDISFDAWKFAAAQQAAGGAGNDVIDGTDNADVLAGQGGNDTINAGAGDDIVLGGDGNDDINLGAGNHIVFGGSGDDNINHGTGDDLIYGNDGSDHLYGFEGNDELHGGDGDDTLLGGAGDDTLSGGDGNDKFYGGTGQDLFDGGDGIDTVELQNDDYGGPKPGVNVDLTTGIIEWKDNIYPFEQMISIENVFGTSADDTILGDAGANHLDGIGGNDLLRGGAGDDTLTDAYGDNALYGEDGDDFLYVTGSGNNQLSGGAGDDRIKAYRGQNTIDGGAGSDTLDLSGATTAWDIDVDLTTGSFGTGSNISSFVNIENVIGTPGDNILTGDAGANILDGGNGDDSHFGGDGDDLILGNIGNDSFDGGNGVDTLDFSYTSINLTMDLAGGTVAFQGGIIETATNFENAIGGSGNDQITGTGADNTLQGLTGDDTYTTGAGSDLIRVETGGSNDSVTDFNINNDHVEIDGMLIDPNQATAGVALSQSGADVLISFGSGDSLILTGIDLITWQAATSSGPDGIVTGTESADTINGSFVDADGDVINDLGQTINGLGGDDRVYDGDGDDTVSGGAGRDRFFAGAGADSYDGCADNRDEVFYNRSSVGLTVDLSNTANNTGIAAGDSYTSIERLQGSNHDDILVSGGSTTILSGRAGNDDFTDDAGKDNFRGGTGADTFRFIAGDGKQDRIYDFEIGTDKIDLSAWGVIDFNDLSITEATNSSGTPLGRLVVDFKSESLRLDGLDASDIVNLDTSNFVFAPYSGDAIVSGTNGNDTINTSYFDADGDYVNDQGQAIQGLDGDDRIHDGSGDDIVEGGAGRDRFYAGDGADNYDGGTDNRDEVFYHLSSTGLTVDASNTANSTGIAAGDTFTSVERLQGSNYDDILVSGGSVKILNGRSGDDDFTDDAGKDFFRGGAGADTFHFIAGDNQQDRIYDFELDIDLIDLSVWGATSISDLTFSESLNGSGTPQGDLIIDYGSESLRVDGFNMADIFSFDDSQFIFV